MNLFQQLATANAPAKRRKSRATLSPTDRHPRLDNLMLGAAAKSSKAFEAYKSAMAGAGWLPQRRLEESLGYSTNGSSHYLAKLLMEGHARRRNRDNAPKHRHQEGYEWLWVSGLSKTHIDYRLAMDGRGWMSRSEVEAAVGNAEKGSAYYLQELLEQKHVAFRNNPEGRGFEWEWVSK